MTQDLLVLGLKIGTTEGDFIYDELDGTEVFEGFEPVLELQSYLPNVSGSISLNRIKGTLIHHYGDHDNRDSDTYQLLPLIFFLGAGK